MELEVIDKQEKPGMLAKKKKLIRNMHCVAVAELTLLMHGMKLLQLI